MEESRVPGQPIVGSFIWNELLKSSVCGGFLSGRPCRLRVRLRPNLAIALSGTKNLISAS